MRTLRLFHAIVLMLAATLAQALEIAPYSPQRLAAAQEAGAPVALHFRV
jgi:hypothetical protein